MLTCTGRAIVANPQPVYGLGDLEAAVVAQVRFACPEPVFDLFWPYFPSQYVSSTLLRNGQTFTLQVERSQLYPSSITASAACSGAYVQADPTLYNVSVVVGWGFGSASEITTLEAAFGTVSPAS